MMVMVGYPDFLLKPEAVDKEYEVGLPPACSCPAQAAGLRQGCGHDPGQEPTTTAEKELAPGLS